MTQQALARTNQKQPLSVVKPTGGRNGIAKIDMQELRELAEVFVTSKMFPDVTQTAQAMVKIIAGHELGFEPIVSMTGIHIFQGKVSIGANLLASLIKDSGKYQYKVTEHTNTACEIVFYQQVGDEWKQLGVPVRYTLKEAADAGLAGKDVWKKYPADMLFASVIRKGCRRYCADVLRGTGSDHDVADEVEIDARATEIATLAHTPDEPEFSGELETVDAVLVDRSRDDLVAEVKTLTQKLNKAGDSIKWTPSNLTEYINDLFSVSDGLDALSGESFDILIGDLQGRLSELAAIPQ